MIQARDITLSRGGRSILRALNLKVAPGEIAGIVGPNGCGKTTLMRVLGGVLRPESGTVHLNGVNIAKLSRRRIARNIGVVPQGRPHDHGQTVADLVMLGRFCRKDVLSSYRTKDHEAVDEALERVGLAGWGGRRLSILSGGEVQRAMIARALCQAAPCLLLDEPTNHLDLNYQHGLLELIRGLECTVVLVLHDLNLAARYCDRIHLLHNGALEASGTPRDVLQPERLASIYRIGMTQIRTAAGHVYLMIADAPLDTADTTDNHENARTEKTNDI